MITTLPIEDTLDYKIEQLSRKLNKKKSVILKEAIDFYIKNTITTKESRILDAIQKTKESDAKEYQKFEGTLVDGI